MTRIGDLGAAASRAEEHAISWSVYIERHAAHRARALTAADALLAGRGLSLAGWQLPDLSLTERVLAVRPTPRQLRSSLGDPAPPASPRRLAPSIHRAELEERTLEGLDPTPRLRAAWAIERLNHLGNRVDERERVAWEGPWWHHERDADAAACWAGWLAGTSWDQRVTFEGLFLPHATRAFRAVLASRRVPQDAVRRALDGLQESFFYRLMMPDSEGIPGWAELAARTLETAEGGPVLPLVRLLGDRERRLAAICASSRGSWRRTVQVVEPAPLRLDRAAALERRLEHAEALLDTHVVLRLLGAWAQGRMDGDWPVVTQGRGRVRSRLRRLATATPGPLAEAVLGLDALYDRTAFAVRRYAWAWAWAELAVDFAFDLSRSVSPPCVQTDELQRLDPALEEALATWILLVALRGRTERLRRWAATGTTGDRDTTWGRLLAQDLPRELVGGATRYATLRLAVNEQLDEILAGWQPLLARIAGLPDGRRLRREVDELLAPHWHAAVPQPRSGFPTMKRCAAELSRRLERP